jgi:hypothetical protein
MGLFIVLYLLLLYQQVIHYYKEFIYVYIYLFIKIEVPLTVIVQNYRYTAFKVAMLLSVLDHQSVWKEMLCKTGNIKYICKFKIFTI